MKSRQLIDNIFEAEGDPAAPKGGEQATVSVQITGNPKQIQKALKQLAKDKPTGVKVKADGKEVKPDSDVKIDDKSSDKKPVSKVKADDKKPKKDEKFEKDEDKDGDDKE